MALRRSSRRVAWLATTLTMAVIAGTAGLVVSAPSASAAETVLFSQSFHDKTVDGSAGAVALPAAQTGTNAACLTASGNATANPLASCSSANDTQGSGTLRLTPDTTNQVGAVFATGAVPTSQGLDITFNIYQYGTATPSTADGTGFVLAAVNPADPVTPPVAGPTGGSLGYSASVSKGFSGLTDGYAAVGFDEHGNFSNPIYEGSGCTNPANIDQTMAGQVVMRGPGNGQVGYCPLASTAATATSAGLTLRAATRAASEMPVEVVVNPTSSSITTPSGLVVPAGELGFAFTPVGGSLTTRLVALPTVPAGLYPASWVSASGLPKELAFGWVASTGADVDYHEIDSAVVNTLLPAPVLAVSQTSYAAATLSAGSPVTYTVAASSSGVTENSPVTVTETLPSGVVPVGASGPGWVCGAPSGQQITCTDSTSPFTSGTFTVNGIVTSGSVTPAMIHAGSTAAASSSDGVPATSTTAPGGTVPAAPSVTGVTPTNGTAGGGNGVTVSGTNLGGATAIEIGTAAEFAAGTPATLNLCTAAAAGCFTVTSSTSLNISSMPAHAAGAVQVSVVSLGIASTGAYTYNPSPTLQFSAPPGGEVGVAYSDQLTETGGTSPFTWSVSSGTLPPGVTLAASTGLLSGTPTAAGSYTFTVEVTDAGGLAATESVSMTIIAGPSLHFPTPSDGETGSVYSDTLAASGGTGPYTWSVSSGTPPAGITLSSAGVLAGTPTAAGTGTFTVKVTDADGQSATEATSLAIISGPALSFPAPPSGEIGTAYSDTLTASGGTGPYAWSVSAGTLPAGITLGSATGTLSGTPTAAGTSTFTVKVTDADGQSATEATALAIIAGPALSFPAPPSGEIGTAYSDTLAASGGTGAYTWSVSAGSLPAGITLGAATGTLAGTPTASGTFSLTVQVTDADGQSATEATTLTIIAGPGLSFAGPPSGEIGSAYSDSLAASGGTGPYSWSVSAGTLPAGITLGSATGTLSGTPTAAGTSTFTVKVTDAVGQSATEATSVTIISGPALNFPAPPYGEISSVYSDTVTASGGTGPYTWSVSAGTLPAGITLGAATGTLTGTPAAAGTSTFTVHVTDADGQSATEATTLAIIAGPALSFPAPSSGQIGTAYSDTLTASGGTGPYTWSVSAGSLPAGITLGAATGTLAGTPTAAGTFSFTVQVTDADGQSATEATSLVVTPSAALATSAASVSFGKPVTFTATIAPAAASGSVTFSDLLSSGPQSGQAVTLGTTALSAGTATLTVDLPAFNTNTVKATYSGDLTHTSAASIPAGVQVTAYSGEVILNQFRLSGPGGAGDQYAELYNSGPAVSVAGFTLAASSGASVTVPSSAPVLASGGTYLIAGAAYSLSAIAIPDLSTASLGTAGLQVIAPDGPGTVTDAAGSAGARTGFYSGTPLPALSGTPTDQYAWVRLEKAGTLLNSASNAADFQLVSTTGGVVGGVQSCLGSPSPQATGSPAQANANIQSTLLDPAKSAIAAPNFVYVRGTPGLLTIRRTITNISATVITSAEIRITSLSEVNGPPEPGVTTQPATPAEFRIINPATPTTQIAITGGHVVTVQNLSVAAPATASPGGGLDTTLTIPLPGGSLAPGASVSAALSLAVDRHGPFWFGYDLDAISAPVSAPAGQSQTRRPATPLPHLGIPSPYAIGRGTLP